MPGAAVTEQLDDKTYAGTLLVKVGPVSASYKGQMTFARLDAQGRSAEIVASGQDVRGKGGATMRLTSKLVERAPDETEVVASSEVNVTGILAQMGRGMIQDVSDEMFQIFSERMRAELESGAPSAAPSSVAGPDGSPAAGSSGSPAASAGAPSVPAPITPATPEALDAAAIGARVARRSAMRLARQPAFWAVILLIAAGVALLLLNRSSSGP
jgi:carbon monoxide dehydrogenase subunit G